MLDRLKGAGILVALLLSAAGALAQSGMPVTNTYDAVVTDALTVNQCSIGEPVSLNGVLHISYSVSTDSSGLNHYAIQAANDLTGVGQKTGVPYVASDSDNYSSDNDDSSADLTVELKSDLKSQGPVPGLTLVQALHVVVDTAGNISAQVVGNSTGCGS